MEPVGNGMVDSGGGNHPADNELDSSSARHGRLLPGRIHQAKNTKIRKNLVTLELLISC